MGRLYLIAGHGGKDPGAIAVDGKTTEADLAAELVSLICDNLKGYEVFVDVSDRNQSFGQDLSFVRQNATPDDTVIEVHFNAFHLESANGTEAYYTKSDSTAPIKLGVNLLAAIIKSTGFRNRGIKPESNSQHARLAILHTQAKDELLLEVCFITNKSDFETYQSNKKQIAKDIASCLIQAKVVTKKAKKSSTEELV